MRNADNDFSGPSDFFLVQTMLVRAIRCTHVGSTVFYDNFVITVIIVNMDLLWLI